MEKQQFIEKEHAIHEVREMAYQFADMYFTFVEHLRTAYGDEEAKKIVSRVLFTRARERALIMRQDAEKQNIAMIPENIPLVSRVPYLGWDKRLGCDHCPYGTAWNRRIAQNEWFREYAFMYCNITDTTIAQVFTGRYSHRLTRAVVLADETCERIYFESEAVQKGILTFDQP